MIGITLKSDALDELIKQSDKLGESENMAMVGARAAANVVRAHLFALDGTRANKMGGERTHFYSNAAKSVHEPVSEGATASFTITQIGLAQRWLGGEIRAGMGESSATGLATKYLAIPARAEAYGKTPGEFDDLTFIRTRNGGALVEELQTAVSFGRKKKDGTRTVKRGETTGSLVMFWLVESVIQKEDPTVMPTEEEMGNEAREAMTGYLSDLLKS
jgi:hypothetical protein